MRPTYMCDTPLDSSQRDEKNEYNIVILQMINKIFKFLFFAKKLLKMACLAENVSS